MDSPLHKTFDFNLKPLHEDITVCEYIWLGGTGQDLRSKTMVIITLK